MVHHAKNVQIATGSADSAKFAGRVGKAAAQLDVRSDARLGHARPIDCARNVWRAPHLRRLCCQQLGAQLFVAVRIWLCRAVVR